MKWSGMEVADHDGVEGARIQQAGQPGQRTLPEIEQDRGLVVPDEVGGARRAWSVGEGGAGADDVQPKCRAIRLAEPCPKPSALGRGVSAQVTRCPEDATAGACPGRVFGSRRGRPARRLASASASGGAGRRRVGRLRGRVIRLRRRPGAGVGLFGFWRAIRPSVAAGPVAGIRRRRRADTGLALQPVRGRVALVDRVLDGVPA